MKKIRTLVLMAIAMVAVTFGDIFLKQAMDTVGEVSVSSLEQALQLGRQIFTQPKVWQALGLFATFFFIWLSVLSWEELSFVLPLTALTYLLNAFLAGPVLGEEVGALRWAGTLLIGVGVVLVTLSGEESGAGERAERAEPEPLQA